MNPTSELNERSVREQRNRGGCFTAFLLVVLIMFAGGTIYLLIISIFGSEALQQAFPAITREYWLWSALLAMAIFIAFLGIWWWRKWGVYTFIVISVIGFLVDISLMLGGGIFNLLRCAILVVLLFFLIRNKWSLME